MTLILSLTSEFRCHHYLSKYNIMRQTVKIDFIKIKRRTDLLFLYYTKTTQFIFITVFYILL